MSLDVAWIAGVLDARGHIRLEARRGVPQPRIRVTTRKTALLEHMASLTGTKPRYDTAGYERRNCSEHCKHKHEMVRQSAYWDCDGIRATIILHSCLPHMVAQRAEAMEVLRVGYEQYSAARNGIAASMLRLGWTVPLTNLHHHAL